MPSDQDVRNVEHLIASAISTYFAAFGAGDLAAEDRRQLEAAMTEFAEVQGTRILDAYRGADDAELVSDGLVGQQLASKVAFVDHVAYRLRTSEQPKTRLVRGWKKRLMVVVESFKGLPYFEALKELLEMLDAGLDRVR